MHYRINTRVRHYNGSFVSSAILLLSHGYFLCVNRCRAEEQHHSLDSQNVDALCGIHFYNTQLCMLFIQQMDFGCLSSLVMFPCNNTAGLFLHNHCPVVICARITFMTAAGVIHLRISITTNSRYFGKSFAASPFSIKKTLLSNQKS